MLQLLFFCRVEGEMLSGLLIFFPDVTVLQRPSPFLPCFELLLLPSMATVSIVRKPDVSLLCQNNRFSPQPRGKNLRQRNQRIVNN